MGRLKGERAEEMIYETQGRREQRVSDDDAAAVYGSGQVVVG